MEPARANSKALANLLDATRYVCGEEEPDGSQKPQESVSGERGGKGWDTEGGWILPCNCAP